MRGAAFGCLSRSKVGGEEGVIEEDGDSDGDGDGESVGDVGVDDCKFGIELAGRMVLLVLGDEGVLAVVVVGATVIGVTLGGLASLSREKNGGRVVDFLAIIDEGDFIT